MLYALTGEYVAPAGSDTAINADRLLLVCADNEKILLYLSDGKRFYAANGNVSLKHAELSAMANDSRLFDFSVTPSGIAICAGSPHAAELTLLASAPDAAQYAGILTLLGYNPDAGIATVADSVSIQAVAPHGTLHISDTALTYTAAHDSGIPISDFLEIAKSELDIDMYDILQASVSLAEQLRAIAPLAFGGEGKLHLRGFYREDDTFTVELGLYTAGIAIHGDAYPYFARLTVQGGTLIGLDVRFLQLTRNAYIGTLFPSNWQYDHAAKSAELDTLRLTYRVQMLPAKSVVASWLFTGTKQTAEVIE